jgi:phosphate/sulfate permease
MHKNPEFVFVLVVAAVSMAALVYLVFTLAGGIPSSSTDSATGMVVGNTQSPVQSPGTGASWFINPFLAGFVLVVIAGTIIYHYWHHE